MSKGSLLLVDDDRHVLNSMADWLRGLGHELDTASSLAEAVEADQWLVRWVRRFMLFCDSLETG